MERDPVAGIQVWVHIDAEWCFVRVRWSTFVHVKAGNEFEKLGILIETLHQHASFTWRPVL